MSLSTDVAIELADQTALFVTASGASWRSFMRFAARNYKYSFRDQLMIYGQKPDATACASREQWEMDLDRSIKEDAREIALLDDSGDDPEIRHVYDVTDTEGEDVREIGLFVMKPEYRALIHKRLTEA